MIEGTIFDHESPHSNLLAGARGKQFIDALIGTKVFLLVEEQTRLRMFKAEKVYVHQAKVEETEPLILGIVDDTLLIPIDNDKKDSMHTHQWMIEEFCGGFGGWQHGQQFLRQFGMPLIRTIALDFSFENIIQFGISHGFQMVVTMDGIDSNFLHDYPFDTAINTDVTKVHWQKLIQWIDPEFWTISAPCTSWSGAGHGAGFDSQDGMALAHSMSHIKLHQPKYVGIEQVEGFTKHEQFAIFVSLVHWAGYRFHAASVQELAALAPVRRRRWLGILVRNDIQTSDQGPQGWPLGMTKTIHFDALQILSDAELPRFQPTKAEAEIYFDPQYLSPFSKNRDRATVIQQRLPTLQEPLPTVMAAYSQ